MQDIPSRHGERIINIINRPAPCNQLAVQVQFNAIPFGINRYRDMVPFTRLQAIRSVELAITYDQTQTVAGMGVQQKAVVHTRRSLIDDPRAPRLHLRIDPCFNGQLRIIRPPSGIRDDRTWIRYSAKQHTIPPALWKSRLSSCEHSDFILLQNTLQHRHTANLAIQAVATAGIHTNVHAVYIRRNNTLNRAFGDIARCCENPATVPKRSPPFAVRVQGIRMLYRFHRRDTAFNTLKPLRFCCRGLRMRMHR